MEFMNEDNKQTVPLEKQRTRVHAVWFKNILNNEVLGH
jgi:hypothetical protein